MPLTPDSPGSRCFESEPPLLQWRSHIPHYLDARGRVSTILTSNPVAPATLLPELEENLAALAMSRTRFLVAIGHDTDRLAMNGLREASCTDFGGAVQVRSAASATWSADFVSLPFLTSDDPIWCPPQNEFGNGSLDCIVDGSLPLTCNEPIGDWTNRLSEDYGSVLSFYKRRYNPLIGDMRRRTAGNCLQNPDSTRSVGLRCLDTNRSHKLRFLRPEPN